MGVVLIGPAVLFIGTVVLVAIGSLWVVLVGIALLCVAAGYVFASGCAVVLVPLPVLAGLFVFSAFETARHNYYETPTLLIWVYWIIPVCVYCGGCALLGYGLAAASGEQRDRPAPR